MRTPLNAIIGLTDMMVANAPRFGTEKAFEPLKRVHRAGIHLLGLINQVLDLSKIEAGKLELEGLKLARELQPSAILLDVMMPDLDGWSVLAALRQDARLAEIPVIMVSILDEQRRGMALGAAGYLTKPVDRARLISLVQRFASPTQQTRILLVDDDPLHRGRMSSWLDAPHWAITEAGNGREALERLQEQKPDLILLDLVMPEMDGFQVVAALQSDQAWRDIPVIVITSLDLSAADHERLNSGVQSILVKDLFRPADLVERIRRLAPTGRQEGGKAAS